MWLTRWLMAAFLLAAAPVAAQAAPVRVTIVETDQGVSVSYESPEATTRLEIGGDQGAWPSDRHRLLEPGLRLDKGAIASATPFRRATLLIAPDERDVDARYPLVTRTDGGGAILYAPYILPSAGSYLLRVSTGGRRLRTVTPKEASGGYLIVGARPRPAGSFDALTSANVDGAAETFLHGRLAQLLDFYSGRLQSRLRLRPTVVIAREAATDRATGYRGDVTPNGKIVLRFRGTPPHPAEPKAAGQVTGFLAHELFHLWNARDGDFPADEAWVHEGSADYYSWLAVAAVWPQELKLEDRLQQAANSCRAFGGTRPVAQLNPRLRYSCGALAHWIVDVAARNASSGARTGFDLWAQLVRPGRDYTLAELREKVAELAPLASQPIADFIQTGWDWPKLARSLAAAGADVQGGEPGAQAMRFAAGRAIGRELCDGFSGAGWSEADGVYLTGEGCGDLGGRISVQEIGGADPMKDTQRVYDIVARACAEQAKLDLVLRGSGDPVRRTIRCTRAFEPAPPEFSIRRALPLNPPARSGP
jgi:hypothetical protein